MKIPLVILSVFQVLLAYETYYSHGKLQKLHPEKEIHAGNTTVSVKRVGSSIKWYKTDAGRKVGILSKIVVHWNSGADIAKVMKELQISGEEICSNYWTITVPAGRDIFELSRELYEHPATVSASPDMIQERSMR